MTYNIRSGRGVDGRLNLERIARVIEAENPDVVALQEVDVRRRRTRLQDQAHELAQRLGYHGAFVAAQTLRNGQGEYGNALISRFPLRDCRRVALPRPLRLPAETRCLMQCTVDWPEGPVQVWNTHLGLFSSERRSQIKHLLGCLEEVADQPMVLCGDFNARPKSKELLGLIQGMTHVPTQRTYPGFLPVVQLDHVFHTPQLQVKHCYVPRNPLARRASDHLPIVVDLDAVVAFDPATRVREAVPAS